MNILTRVMNKNLIDNMLADKAPGYVPETLESAGCTGQCPMYPGAPKTEDGFPDCPKCPQRVEG